MPWFPVTPAEGSALNSSLLSLLYLIGAAAIASAAGGVVPLCRSLSDRTRGYLLHLAAGVLLAVIAVELLPDIRELDRPAATIAGLVAGAATMTLLNLATRRLEARRAESDADGAAMPVGLVAAAGIDSAVDGLLVGIGYAADPDLGVLLATGIGIEKFTMTMTVAAELRQLGHSPARVLFCSVAIALVLVPAAIAGQFLLADPSNTLHAFVLAAAAAALLYLVTIELVARGRDTHDSPATVLAFFTGFIGLASYAMLAPA